MQAYGPGFAGIYNQRWIAFAHQVAPALLDFYAASPAGQRQAPVLDLCCGTGQLAVHFLEHGCRVIGLDLSESMLKYARENALPYLVAGQAQFVQADAVDFSLPERVGFVVSTFDALNHLDGMEALRRCFGCVRAVLDADGHFVFDLNTRLGLKRWNSINVDDGDEMMIVTRGIYDGQGDRAFTRITGFSRTDSGLYERFEETAFNTAFELRAVREALLEAGWQGVHFARLSAPATPLEDPEAEGRVFVVAGG